MFVFLIIVVRPACACQVAPAAAKNQVRTVKYLGYALHGLCASQAWPWFLSADAADDRR
jgi:hypothetical protein